MVADFESCTRPTAGIGVEHTSTRLFGLFFDKFGKLSVTAVLNSSQLFTIMCSIDKHYKIVTMAIF